MQPSSSEREKKIWSGFSTKKSIHVVVKFGAYKSLGMLGSQKVFFQSCQRPVSMKWGQEYECMHPSRFWNRRSFWSGFCTKKVLMSLSNFALKKVDMQIREMCFQSSQVIVQMNWGQEQECMHPSSSEREETFDLVFLRKKVLMSLSNFAPI